MVGLQVSSERKQIEFSDIFDVGCKRKIFKNDFDLGLGQLEGWSCYLLKWE